MNRHDEANDTPAEAIANFYKSAFWWMMGLVAAGVVALIAVSLNLKVAVGRLETQLESSQKAYDKLTAAVERLELSRFTAVEAQAMRSELFARLESVARQVDTVREQVSDLRARNRMEAPK